MRLTSNYSCYQLLSPPFQANARRKVSPSVAGQFLIPTRSSGESSPFVEGVQHESRYDGVCFQCLSDWHYICFSKGIEKLRRQNVIKMACCERGQVMTHPCNLDPINGNLRWYLWQQR